MPIYVSRIILCNIDTSNVLHVFDLSLAYISIDFSAKTASVYRKIEEEGKIPYITSEKLDIDPKDSLEEEIKSFLESIIHRRKPLVPGEAGLRALKVALEIANQLRIDTQRIAG